MKFWKMMIELLLKRRKKDLPRKILVMVQQSQALKALDPSIKYEYKFVPKGILTLKVRTLLE